MNGAASKDKVTLVTWQPIWFYWPAYLALAGCLKSKEFSDLDLEFSVGETTDTSIRRAFYELLDSGSDALAICEPREFTHRCGPGGTPGQQTERLVRRIPIVWRLPHWLYWNGDVTNVDTISALPENSTSGDYVKRVVMALPDFQGREIRFGNIDGSLQMEREALAAFTLSRGTGGVASYTPWHVVPDSPGGALNKLALPGPRKEVTSLLYVSKDKGDRMSRLADSFCSKLKAILISMGDTHGDRGLMSNFVAQHTEDVERIVNRHGGTEPTWDLPFLSSALAEYVLMGCYFPYSSIDAAMSAEIRWHVEQRLKEMSLEVLKNVQGDMRSFLGVDVHWRDMSFDERINVWSHLKSKDSDGRSLFSIWSHDEQKAYKLLNEVVPVGIHMGHFELKSLVSELPPACPYKDAIASRPAGTQETSSSISTFNECNAHALRQGMSGAMPFSDSDADACALCVLSGATDMFARSAALRLRRYCDDVGHTAFEIGHAAGRLLKQDARTYSGCCPVSIWDVDDMLRTFAAESSRVPEKTGSGPPCKVVVYNGFKHSSDEGDVLFAIYWRGKTTEHSSGEGRATDRMAGMAAKGNEVGRHISSAGFWKKERSPQAMPVTEQRSAQFIESTPFFNAAYEQFEGSDYNFAYVAVFSRRAIEEPAE